MSDIFDEVDEDVRRERFTKLWERYGNLVIALAVLVVLGVAGWRGYDYWRTKQAEQFGATQAARENIDHLRNGAAAVVTGQQVASALKVVAQRGVKCRVLLDGFASRSDFRRKGLARQLKACGIEVVAADTTEEARQQF